MLPAQLQVRKDFFPSHLQHQQLHREQDTEHTFSFSTSPEAGHCLLPTFCLHHYPWMQILQPHVDTSMTYCGQIPQPAVWPLGMTQNWKIRLTNKALSGGI